MRQFQIGDRWVGDAHPPLVIAEIGINHEGSLDVAKTVVDSAHRAGAEIIKHQTHVVEDEMSDEARKMIPGNADDSIYDIMARCALDEDQERALKDYVESLGMIFISTPFSRAASERLDRMDVAAYKIGSGECNNYPLVKHIARKGKPMILSTGMNSIESVAPAVEIMRANKIPFALLHTTNLYPTPRHLVRLGAMMELHAAFPDAVFGLSDHTTSNSACLGAVALGASVLERHYTDTRERPGPDIACSMDEKDLGDLIVQSREVFECRGGGKHAVPEEQVTMDFAFATAVTIAPVKAGELLSRENLWLKRPGVGEIKPSDFESILGRTVKRDIDSGVHIAWADISE
jgi:N-acetylneuraminate synthase